jgi:DNA (cytosine-5)-methyltransferase 1
MKDSSLQILDLFSGAGGFSLGAYLAGFRTALAIDNDRDLTCSYKLNFPNSTYRTADLSLIEPLDILRAIDMKRSTVSGILGGPPCQGFSMMGKRRVNDPRNALVYRFFHFVNVIDPHFFVLENVPGILSDPFRSILEEGICLVTERYSVVGPLTLDAADFGAATSRKRTLVIGYRTSRVSRFTVQDLTSFYVKDKSTVYQAIHDLPPLRRAVLDKKGQFVAKYHRNPDRGTEGNYARRARRTPPEPLASSHIRESFSEGFTTGHQPTFHTPDVLKRFRRVGPGEVDEVSRSPRLWWKGLCSTLRAGTGSDRGSYQSVRPIHPDEHRVISVREAARIQGFPDWFQFHPTKWHSFRMIGNSVSPYLSSTLLKLIAKNVGQNPHNSSSHS